jgi:hypothetical protein
MRLRNWSVLLAFVAAIMLVIAGGPSVAAAATCDSCPPECPMMAPAPASAAAAGDHVKAPAQGEKSPPSSCLQTGLCQVSPVAPPAAVTAVVVHLPLSVAEHDIVSDRAAPSRPPDPHLRPPIRL